MKEVLLILLIACMSFIQANVTTITVGPISCTSCNYHRLEEAFLATINLHDVNIFVLPGTYKVNQSVIIYDGLVQPGRFINIEAVNSTLDSHIIDCDNVFFGSPLLYLEGVQEFAMSGFTVQNCKTGNATLPGVFTLSRGQTVTIKNNVYRKNYSSNGSSVMTIFKWNSVTVDSCTFDSNKIDFASLKIAALAIVEANYTVNNCLFFNNSAYAAPAFQAAHSLPYGPQTGIISNCNFTGNTAAYYGGAMVANGDTNDFEHRMSLFINNTVFESNYLEANYTVGGAAQIYDISLTMTFCTFRNNSAISLNPLNPGSGGGLNYNIYRNVSDPVYIADTLFEGNYAGTGGAICFASLATNETYHMERVIIRENKAEQNADAILISFSNVAMKDCVIENNNNELVSVYAFNSDITLQNVTITKNFKGIQCDKSSINVIESSIYNNRVLDITCINYCNWTGLPQDTCTKACDYRDSCSVCDGNYTCVNECDGIPWSRVNCTETSTLTSGTTTGTVGSTMGTSGTMGNANTTGEMISSDVETKTKSKKMSGKTLGGILGGVFGGLFVVAVIVFLILFLKKRKTRGEPILTRQKANSIELRTSTNKTLINIKIAERLGGGAFSDVFRGTWNTTTTVALKMLKDPSQLTAFTSEANMLLGLSHANIVQFYGIYIDSNDNKYIVTEFLSKGSLKDMLISDTEELTLKDMLFIARDVAAGLLYISEQNIVHADIAARNVLITVSNEPNVKYAGKIGDLGLSKSLQYQQNYYQSKNAAFPIKWSAPEVVEFGKYSLQSDIWSFGVTLFEIFSQGRVPYASIANEDIIEKINGGYRLPQPQMCPDNVYKLMLQMWNLKPKERPSWNTILEVLSGECARMLPRTTTNEDKPTSTQDTLLYHNV